MSPYGQENPGGTKKKVSPPYLDQVPGPDTRLVSFRIRCQRQGTTSPSFLEQPRHLSLPSAKSSSTAENRVARGSYIRSLIWYNRPFHRLGGGGGHIGERGRVVLMSGRHLPVRESASVARDARVEPFRQTGTRPSEACPVRVPRRSHCRKVPPLLQLSVCVCV